MQYASPDYFPKTGHYFLVLALLALTIFLLQEPPLLQMTTDSQQTLWLRALMESGSLR
jgi:hypothetical protein